MPIRWPACSRISSRSRGVSSTYSRRRKSKRPASFSLSRCQKEVRLSRSLHRLVFFAVVGSLLLPAAPLLAQYGYGQEPDLQGTGFGKNKIQYREFDWHTYRSPHFNVYFYSQEEPRLQTVISIAESAYDQLSKSLNYQIKEPVPLIYFATHSAFEQNNVLLNFIPENVGAFASPARFRMVLPVDLPDPELLKLIQHELTHIFQYHILY